MSHGSSTTGLPSNIGGLLAYLFGFIGGVALLLIERQDRNVRFHAMQSTLTFLIALVLSLILASVPFLGRLLNMLASLATAGLWLFLMIKAFNGERYKLPYVGEIAERQIQ